MKFNDKFVNYLGNFSTISPQMMFIEGNKQSVFSMNKTIFAQFTSDISIEKSFGIINLPKFINIISVFDEPEIDIEDTALNIHDDKKSVLYHLTKPDFIHYEKNPEKFERMVPKYSFNMNFADYNSIRKIASLLDSNELVFEGDGSKVFLKATNSKDNGDNGKIVLDGTDQLFKVVVKIDKMKLSDANYKIGISEKGAVHFKSDDIEYYLAANVERSSL